MSTGNRESATNRGKATDQGARGLGLAALSALRTPPDELVRHAVAAGFDRVGVRVLPVTDAEPVYDLAPGSPLQRRVLAALEETGVRVHDTEFLLLDGTEPEHPDARERWLRALDAAAGLNAATFTVAAADPEESRLAETLGTLAQDARERGITVTLEPISYQAVRTLPEAARIARQTGCRVLADTLHLSRVGTGTAELDAAADVVGGIQLVDGPARAPQDLAGLVHESRADRRAPGDGEFPLADYLAHLPADLPVSVECCSDDYVARHGAAAWIRYLAERTRTLLAATDAPATP